MQTDAWSAGVSDVSTAFYDLLVEKIKLPPPGGLRGAIAKVGDGLIYLSQKGTVYHLPQARHSATFESLSPSIPFEHEASILSKFQPHTVSVFDVAAERIDDDSYDVFASYLGHDDVDRCVFVNLARARLDVGAAGPRFASPWEVVYRTKPCLPVDELNTRSCLEAGGRIDFSKDGVVLSVGTFMLEGRRDQPTVAQRDDYEYGKILLLDRDTFGSSVISKGHRNPQGLFVSKDAIIFETEHGPRGGDEVNIVVPGQNYGWPLVTYGTGYGGKTWFKSKDQGRHSGFALPLFAFTPSIGISQIVQIGGREFPFWRGDLIVSSLRAESIYRLRYVEGRIVFSEPIGLGTRLRDMVELEDGRLALLTDGPHLLLVANADRRREESRNPAVDGDEVAVPEELPGGDAVRGGRLFSEKCASCHGLTSETDGPGPDLGCVFNSPVAGQEGYDYSAALARRSPGKWSFQALEQYLLEPEQWAPGTTMAPISFARRSDPRDIIAFLAATRRHLCSD